MKKRLISIILALCTICSVGAVAFAAPPKTASPYAVSAPTTYAPSSWYGVPHQWTATYYTYSSYIFSTDNTSYFNSWADQPFTLEVYRPDGTLIMREVAVNNEYTQGRYEANIRTAHHNEGLAIGPYYVILRNNDSTPITQNAYYKVW